jgi:hypothetical protein
VIARRQREKPLASAAVPTVALRRHSCSFWVGQRDVDGVASAQVDGVVSAQVVSKLPHPIEKRLMRMTLQIQRVDILKCDGGRRVQFDSFAYRRSNWTTATSARCATCLRKQANFNKVTESNTEARVVHNNWPARIDAGASSCTIEPAQ